MPYRFAIQHDNRFAEAIAEDRIEVTAWMLKTLEAGHRARKSRLDQFKAGAITQAEYQRGEVQRSELQRLLTERLRSLGLNEFGTRLRHTCSGCGMKEEK